MSSVNENDQFVGAIDQGTSSTRFLIFNIKTQEVVASNQEFGLKSRIKYYKKIIKCYKNIYQIV